MRNSIELPVTPPCSRPDLPLPRRPLLALLIVWLLLPNEVIGQWTWIQPYPQGNTVISSTVAGGTAYFFCEGSTLLVTSDGGVSWETRGPIILPKERIWYGDLAVHRLAFSDSMHGWILRSDGLFASSDAGRTWLRHTLILDRTGAVFFSGPSRGFITGEDLRTANGGFNWYPSGPTSYDDGFFGAFCSIDPLVVWAVSHGTSVGGAKIKLTTDGGSSWQYQPSGLNATAESTFALIAIHMRPSGIGIATGFAQSKVTYRATGVNLRTTDFGNSWIRFDDPPQYNTILSANDSTWVLIGNDWWGYSGPAYQAVFSRSTDAGRTWQRVYEPSSPAPRTGVWLPDQQVMIAAGFDGAVYRSTDLGATWVYTFPNTRTLHDVSFSYVQDLNTSFGFAVGDGGTILRTTDRGQTWTRNSMGPFASTYFIAVKARGRSVWVAGSSGVLLRSTDLGVTWSTMRTPLNYSYGGGPDISCIDVYDSLHVAATTTAHVIYTSDGGDSWELHQLPQGGRISSIALPRPRHIVAGGVFWPAFTSTAGYIWSSTDAGMTWDTTGLAKPVHRLVMFNCQEGVALTSERVMRTVDGGKTWSFANVPSWWPLTGLVTPSEKSNMVIAYLTGGDPNLGAAEGIAISRNKGLNWLNTQLAVPTNEAIAAIASIDGEANVFMTTKRGSLVARTSAIPVAYQPPDPCRAPPIAVFSSNIHSLPVGGGSVVLTWSSYGADSAWIDQGVGAVAINGTRMLKVTHSTEFTISFRNPWGVARSTAQVIVQPPDSFLLTQNYPNPFNPTTTVKFSLPTRTHVTLTIHDVLGKEVAILFRGDHPEGVYSEVWDASHFPSGVYFCRLIAGPHTETMKLLLLR